MMESPVPAGESSLKFPIITSPKEDRNKAGSGFSSVREDDF